MNKKVVRAKEERYQIATKRREDLIRITALVYSGLATDPNLEEIDFRHCVSTAVRIIEEVDQRILEELQER